MLLKDLFQIKYLILAQLLLLGVSAYFDFLPFFLFVGLISILFISYYSFSKPYWFIILLMIGMLIDAFLPIKFKSSGPTLLATEFLLLVLTPIVFLRYLFDYKNLDNMPKILLVWLPFLTWSLVIGLIVGIDKLRIISFWKNYLAGFITFFILLHYLYDSSDVRTIIKSIIIWGVCLVFLEIKVILDAGGIVAGIVGLFLYKNLLSIGWGRSNYLAAFFVIIIPLTIGYLIYSRKTLSKYLLSISLVLMFFAITLTLSRGGILALLISMFILLPKVIKPKYLLSVFALISLITIVLLLNPLTFVIIERMATLDTSGSVYSRINYYFDVWKAFLDYPFTGVGLGNLSYYSKFILGPELSPSAHNIVLGALGELGLFGAIFYLSIFLYIGRKIFLLYRSEVEENLKIFRWCLFSSYIGGMIHTLVEPTMEGLQFSIIFWSITALNFKLGLLREKNNYEQ